MKHTVLAALLLTTAPALAQICIVGKDGCKDISSGKVYEQQGSTYVDPETGEIKIEPPKDYQMTYPKKPGSKASPGDAGVKVKLRKYP